MGFIARVLSFARVQRNEVNVSDVKVDPGGGAITTPEHFEPAGDDAHPMPGDFAAVQRVRGTGREAAFGYVDPLNDQKAQLGEKRIYARDADGVLIVELWLKNDGEATILNANGQVTLKPDGAVLLGVADQAHVLGDAAVTFLGLLIDLAVGICSAPTTMGSVIAVDIAADLETLKADMEANSGDGEILSQKHKTGLT